MFKTKKYLEVSKLSKLEKDIFNIYAEKIEYFTNNDNNIQNFLKSNHITQNQEKSKWEYSNEREFINTLKDYSNIPRVKANSFGFKYNSFLAPIINQDNLLVLGEFVYISTYNYNSDDIILKPINGVYESDKEINNKTLLILSKDFGFHVIEPINRRRVLSYNVSNQVYKHLSQYMVNNIKGLNLSIYNFDKINNNLIYDMISIYNNNNINSINKESWNQVNFLNIFLNYKYDTKISSNIDNIDLLNHIKEESYKNVGILRKKVKNKNNIYKSSEVVNMDGVLFNKYIDTATLLCNKCKNETDVQLSLLREFDKTEMTNVVLYEDDFFYPDNMTCLHCHKNIEVDDIHYDYQLFKYILFDYDSKGNLILRLYEDKIYFNDNHNKLNINNITEYGRIKIFTNDYKTKINYLQKENNIFKSIMTNLLANEDDFSILQSDDNIIKIMDKTIFNNDNTGINNLIKSNIFTINDLIRYLLVWKDYPSISILAKDEKYLELLSNIVNDTTNNIQYKINMNVDNNLLKMLNINKIGLKVLNEVEQTIKNLLVIQEISNIPEINSFDLFIKTFNYITSNESYIVNFDILLKNLLFTIKNNNIQINIYDIYEYIDAVYTYQKINYDDILKIWKNYLIMAKKLNYDLNIKSVIFPNSLKREFDIAQYYMDKENNNKSKHNNLQEYFDSLKSYIYEDDKYIIITPKNIDDIINEKLILNNYVETNTSKLLKENIQILFMREKRNPQKPFFTIEIRDKKYFSIYGENGKDLKNKNEFIFVHNFKKTFKFKK